MKRKIVLLAIVIALAAGVVGAFLVPITVGGKEGPAKPGAPAYTEALKSSALPPVPPKFGGEIKPVEKESKVWWPPTVVPPKGAPNVLLIMTDDVGFGAPSTFGGVIPTPALDRIAQAGLRYTRLGAGRTGVQASVQVYEITPEGMRNVESLQADAKSSYKPGMALMMGAGGLAGNLLTSAVVSGITSAASEATWDTVNSDGSRLAKNVAKNLGQFFVIQGWISPEALQ